IIYLKLQAMKSLHLTLILSAISIGSIALNPLLGATASSLAQNSGIDPPFCYMQTPDGRTVDLGKLCEKQPATNSQNCVAGNSISAKVSIASANYDGNFLSGQVINQGCKVIRNVRVNYEVLDETGNLIDSGFIDAEPTAVVPGQSAKFRGPVVAGAKVRATHADGKE
ncbi:MAG: FxLYD domain-containing protein, partial [Microcoleus sp.]